MNEFQEQGWFDIPMLIKLNTGGGKTRPSTSFCIDNSQGDFLHVSVWRAAFFCVFSR
jgi:hypothetical protein